MMVGGALCEIQEINLTILLTKDYENISICQRDGILCDYFSLFLSIYGKVRSLNSAKVQMYFCAACHAVQLHVNGGNLIGIVLQI